MLGPAVEVCGIGKRFRIGRRVRQAGTLGETLAIAASRQLDRMRSLVTPRGRARQEDPEDFWALRNVSFEVAHGQVLGIIGRNGSGKSTLLKILSKITTPTEGEATIVGRVGSLLEIGTGFHGELTGRENIFLSGTILGMKRREISARFDEIVDFSGVEQFIDTPVKHYSSGMYLRLGFAVAAHLRTEILLIDEVLSVGDAAFQKKCINKMSEVAREGRTVLFVSHNMAAVTNLCDQGIVLSAGRVAFAGSAASAVGEYQRIAVRIDEEVLPSPDCGVVIRRLRPEPPAARFEPGTPMSFCFDLEVRRPYWEMALVFGLRTLEDEGLVLDAMGSADMPAILTPGVHTIRVSLPGLWLAPRTYTAQTKVVAHPPAGGTERFLSERLDVVIESDGSTGLTDRLLRPRTDWQVASTRVLPTSDDLDGPDV